MVNLILVKNTGYDKHPYYVINISDEELMSERNKHSVVNIPAKLPMICKPKPFTKKSLGGYILNSTKFNEKLLIEKKNTIYYLVLILNTNLLILRRKLILFFSFILAALALMHLIE